MDYEETLLWYRQSRFTADDVTRATGLSERSQRELLKLGVIQAVQQLNPKAQRLVDATMLKRAAIIAPLNRAGLSLGVAGRMVYAAMMLEDLVFGIVDPWDVYYGFGNWPDPETGRLEPRKLPHNRDTWFDPAFRPARANLDLMLAVVDTRFVLHGQDEPKWVYGELTPDLTDFIWWENGAYDQVRERSRDGVAQLSVYGLFDDSQGAKTISFTTKSATEDDGRYAEAAMENPVSKLEINASLALRVALRRLLRIDDLPET